MPTTNLKNTNDARQSATDKLKAIGEEIASWFLLVSAVTALIQFFSHLN
jgi:hypothetical protein